MFEANEYVSEYNYFYTTYQGGYIEAIVGIDKDYDLVKVSGWSRTTDWQKIEPGSQKLKEKVEAMYNPSKYGYILLWARWQSGRRYVHWEMGNPFYN